MKKFISQAWQDATYAVRILARAKLFTATAVVCLALGIGGNTALFSAVRAILWASLPWENAEQIVAVEERNAEGHDHSVALPNFDDWAEQQTTMESLGAFRRLAFNLSGVDRPEHIVGAQATAGVLQALRVKPTYGRIFNEDDDHPGAEPVVMISHALHDRLFDGDAGVIGQTIELDARAFTVVGVLPDHYRLLGTQAVLVPLGLYRDSFPGFSARGTHPNIVVIGRVADGLTIDDARAELSSIAARLGEAYPKTNARQSVSVHTLLEHQSGPARTPAMFLLAAVGLVLLIATANVAGLLVARAHARAREFGVRRALGATRGRLVRQLLTESLVLGVLGGAAGALVGAWGLEGLLEVLPEEIPRLGGAEIDWVVLAFTAAVSAGAAVLFGLLPAAVAIRYRVTRMTARAQAGLVVGELALAVVLIAMAGLTLKSFQAVNDSKLGFQPDGVVSARILLTKDRYPDAASWGGFFDNVLGEIEAMPGVQNVSHGTMTPMWEYSNTSRVHSEDNPASGTPEMDPMLHFVVGVDYFETVGAELLAGRTYTSADMEGGHPVAIIDREMADAYWPGEDPIGKRISWGGNPAQQWREVVGVVETMQHYDVHRGQIFQGFSPLDERQRQGLADFGMTMSILVRAEGDLGLVADGVRQAVIDVDADQPVFAALPLTEIVAKQHSPYRAMTIVFGTFAGLALLLAAIGLYGVTSYTVGRRTREIGIRIALGATRRDVVRLIVRQSARLALIGAGIGLALAVPLSLAMRGVLYGVSTLEPFVFAATTAMLLAVATLAAYLPARRATRIDPTTALRRE